MSRPRVLYYLWEYPQLSQTYIKSEIEALQHDYEIKVLALRHASQMYSNHLAYDIAPTAEEARELAEDFHPDVIHTHWLHLVPEVAKLSRALGVPWTCRSHSFDVLWAGFRGRWYDRLPVGLRALQSPVFARAAPLVSDDLCLGMIAFPFTVPRFRKAGVPEEKLHADGPVVNVGPFMDRSPNGNGVINAGATREKKGFEEFLDVAQRVPNREFSLYAMGAHAGVGELAEQNTALGSPVRLAPVVEPEAMPSEYKRNEWLLYTASAKYRSVGWPVVVAEAQASGVGVCMPDIGRDIHQYLGGAGFTYTSLADAPDILSKPFPAELRELGFEVATRSDFATHKHVLTDLWHSNV